ncbi:hypothetical protein FACS1894188_12640 [Clostridia bacterium]|nr:hypothetical protein FACS1894188_12640 [Clostridia bacterium]
MSNTTIDDLTSTVYNDVLEEILSDSAIEGVYEYFKGRFKEILLSKSLFKIFL